MKNNSLLEYSIYLMLSGHILTIYCIYIFYISTFISNWLFFWSVGPWRSAQQYLWRCFSCIPAVHTKYRYSSVFTKRRITDIKVNKQKNTKIYVERILIKFLLPGTENYSTRSKLLQQQRLVTPKSPRTHLAKWCTCSGAPSRRARSWPNKTALSFLKG